MKNDKIGVESKPNVREGSLGESQGGSKRRLWNYWEKRPVEPKTYVDEVTGEIKEGYPPSKVDMAGYETLEQMVKRFMISDPHMVSPGMYEVPAGYDPERAIAENIINRRGLDRVDRARIISDAKEVMADIIKNQQKNIKPEEKKEQKNENKN